MSFMDKFFDFMIDMVEGSPKRDYVQEYRQEQAFQKINHMINRGRNVYSYTCHIPVKENKYGYMREFIENITNEDESITVYLDSNIECTKHWMDDIPIEELSKELRNFASNHFYKHDHREYVFIKVSNKVRDEMYFFCEEPLSVRRGKVRCF